MRVIANVADTNSGYIAEMIVEGLGRLVFDDLLGDCLLRDKQWDPSQPRAPDAWTRGDIWWPGQPEVVEYLNRLLSGFPDNH